MSNFNQSGTAATSLSNGDHSTAGTKARFRGTDLRPRLRGAPRGTTKGLNPISSSFHTRLGLRKVPRQKFALRPDAPMIKNARQGVMSNFLRSSIIIRASDLDSMVNPKTAIISLTDAVEMETDHLSDEKERMPESERSLENLFYICVQGDELPSYHFWRGKDDPDPINVHRPIDRTRVFHSNAIAEMKPADDEQARKQRHSEPAAPSKPMHTSNVKNDLTKGGSYYRDNNPKRDSQLRSQTAGKAANDAQWQPKGALLHIPYKGSDQRNAEGAGRFGPQPGDPEWEEVEMNWESRLNTDGLKQILRELEIFNPERYRELTHGKKLPMVKPARGQDIYDYQFNQVLKATVPTVAFKLTQQHFNRPTSPLNFQEPLVRGEDPKGWGLQGNEAHEFDTSYEIVQHREGELEFLDFYDDKSNGEFILRRRKAIPEEQIHREINRQSPHLGGHVQDKHDAQNLPMEPLSLDSDTDISTMNKQRAARERADAILKNAREEEQIESMRRERQVPPNSSSAGGLSQNQHFRHNSRLDPESVYKSPTGEIQLPRYESTLDWEINGGPDMPTVYARVPTLSEIQMLQRRVWHLENQILQREDYCRVCDEAFVHGTSDIEEHYREHRLGLVCPCCQQDWREKTRQDQIAHLALSHQLGPPLAQGALGTAGVSGPANIPIITEIVCTFNGCHAPLHELTVEERSNHAEMHARMNQISQPPDACSFLGCHVNLNTLKEREREEHTLMHTLTHNTQDSTLVGRSCPPLNLAPPANSAPPAIPAPGQPPMSPPQHTTSSPRASPPPKLTHSEPEQERDLYGRILRNSSQGWYCAICYTNVTMLGRTKQQNHARNCKTSFQEFLVLTKGEAAQRKRAANSGVAQTAADNGSSLIETTAPGTPGKAQGKKIATGTGAYRLEPTNDSSCSESEKKKRKAAAETKTPGSRKRPRNR